jgi:membrane protein
MGKVPSVSAIKEKIAAHSETGRFRRPLSIAITLSKDMISRDVFKQASAMAYVTLLSLIPSLVAIFVVLSLFSPLMKGGNLIDAARDFILRNLASGTGENVVNYLDTMIKSLDLKTIGWSSFGSVLVTLILLLRQIEEALNEIWLIRKARNIFTRFMHFWTFMTLGVVVVAIVIGVSGFNVKKYIDATTAQAESNLFSSVVFAYVGSFLFFFFLYKIVPNCKVKPKNAAIGGATAAFMLGVAGWGYGVFVSNAGNYKTLYGALAQLPLFLMWLYICWIIILLGAMISWRMQEGFPSGSIMKKSSALEHSENKPIDVWRNTQLKNILPKILLLSIYKNFQKGSGKGITPQDLGHQLKLPVDWIHQAMDTLETMGLVIAAHTRNDDFLTLDENVVDAYFPAFPADKLALDRIDQELHAPCDTWLSEWMTELPDDMQKLFQEFSNQKKQASDKTVSSLM